MFFSRVAVSALSKRSLLAGSRFAAAPWVHNVCWLSTVHVPPPPTSNHFHKPLTNPGGKIIYTETDEAPALATFSLYPAVAKVCFVVSPFVVIGSYLSLGAFGVG